MVYKKNFKEAGGLNQRRDKSIGFIPWYEVGIKEGILRRINAWSYEEASSGWRRNTNGIRK